MTDNVQYIYDMNINLIGLMHKAVIHFRKGKYGKALSIVADSMENIHIITDAIVRDRDYFNLVSTDSIVEMLSGIVEAQRNKDYVLLADLIELQIVMFLCNVQELIMNKEDFCIFSQEKYEQAVDAMLERVVNYVDACGPLRENLNPELLLEQGYRIEFTSCGQMTLAVSDMQDLSYYVHSNHIITGEAYSTAAEWFEEGRKQYIVFGFGLGYVVDELMKLVQEDARVTVFEQDIHVLKLSCGFSDIGAMMQDKRLDIVYDPELVLIREAAEKDADAKVCVFYPAFRQVKDREAREFLTEYLPWADSV